MKDKSSIKNTPKDNKLDQRASSYDQKKMQAFPALLKRSEATPAISEHDNKRNRKQKQFTNTIAGDKAAPKKSKFFSMRKQSHEDIQPKKKQVDEESADWASQDYDEPLIQVNESGKIVFKNDIPEGGNKEAINRSNCRNSDEIPNQQKGPGHFNK